MSFGKPGVPWTMGTRFQAAPVPVPVCPFVSLLWPSPPVGEGGPSHMALECGLKQQDGHPRTQPRSLFSQPIGRMTHCHQCLQVPVDIPPVYNM